MIITVLGAGAMGSALAIQASHVSGNDVRLWGTEFDRHVIEELTRTGFHPCLKAAVPKSVRVYQEQEIGTATKSVEIAVIAVSSEAVRQVTSSLGYLLTKSKAILSVAKGLATSHSGRILTMHQAIEEEFMEAHLPHAPVVSIGGPSIAREVALAVPTSVVYASSAPEAMDRCAAAFESSNYRVSRTSDIVGVEICAVLKNVYAIGIGFCDGISENRGSTMNNTKAALFTSALSEMKRFVKAAGGKENTVYGLAGIGDLNVTCLGGRNSQFGRLIGSGSSPKDALLEMKTKGLTVEGYSSTQQSFDFATQLERGGNLEINVDLPVLQGIYEVLHKGRHPGEIVEELV